VALRATLHWRWHACQLFVALLGKVMSEPVHVVAPCQCYLIGIDVELLLVAFACRDERLRLAYQPMVLVSYILDNYISSLQTKLRHREGHEARRIGLEAMPLDQDIEGGHGEREPGVEICPDAMHHLFEMTD
jgi:hypothetical protein